MSRRIRSIEIARVVCRHWPVTVEELRSRSVARRHSVPRQAAYWLAVTYGGQSTVQAAWWYGRDHTSAIFGIRAVDARMKADPDFAARLRNAAAAVRLLRPSTCPETRLVWPAPVQVPALFQTFEVLR